MEPAEIEHDDNGDEGPEQEQEFALWCGISFAGVVDELGDVAHGFVDGEIFQARVNPESEDEAEEAEENTEEEKLVSGHSQERHRREVGELQVGFAAGFVGACGGSGEQRE